MIELLAWLGLPWARRRVFEADLRDWQVLVRIQLNDLWRRDADPVLVDGVREHFAEQACRIFGFDLPTAREVTP